MAERTAAVMYTSRMVFLERVVVEERARTTSGGLCYGKQAETARSFAVLRKT